MAVVENSSIKKLVLFRYHIPHQPLSFPSLRPPSLGRPGLEQQLPVSPISSWSLARARSGPNCLLRAGAETWESSLKTHGYTGPLKSFWFGKVMVENSLNWRWSDTYKLRKIHGLLKTYEVLESLAHHWSFHQLPSRGGRPSELQLDPEPSAWALRGNHLGFLYALL